MIRFIDFGVYAFRLFVLPFGLFKVNRTELEEEPAGPVPAPCNITVDASSVEGEIDPLIYGSFIEVLAHCIYEGIWDDTNKEVPLIHGGLRQDVIDETRAINLSNIRWPGGCFSDVYEWKEGIGPRDERKIQKNKCWKKYGPKIGPKHNNRFGSDEFMSFIREVGVEPYINVNYGSGTAEEAAQWVEYMNGDPSTEFGSLRAKNSHQDPYNVKIWGIANEIFGFWEEGYCSADEYATRYIKFAKAMRAVDPSIKLVAVGTDFTLYPEWNKTLLTIAKDYIDYISLHVYIPAGVVTIMPNNVLAFYYILSGAYEVERRIEWMEESIAEVMGDKTKIPIALDEWGPMWNVRQHYEGFYTLRDGLFAALVLRILHRHFDTVKLANFAQLVNVIPMIVTSPNDIYHNPIYLAMQLFATYAERFVASSSVTCDARPVPKHGNVEAVDVPLLSCSVTTNQEKNQLVIIGINCHYAHDLQTEITLTNFEPEPNAKVIELNGPHHSAYNSFENKNVVKLQEKEITSAAGQFTYAFPAHSVTALILRKKA